MESREPRSAPARRRRRRPRRVPKFKPVFFTRVLGSGHVDDRAASAFARIALQTKRVSQANFASTAQVEHAGVDRLRPITNRRALIIKALESGLALVLKPPYQSQYDFDHLR